MSRDFDDILAEMTLAEKAYLLAGADMWHTAAVERLDIHPIGVSDGPNGARGREDIQGATSICFPVGVAMGATWNPDLIEQVGNALAAEVRAKNAHVLLAPTVNIHRTPIAGRNFECFAEDPFLSGTIAAAYIKGLQEQGVAACIKHFVANDQEYQRFSISSEVAERPLHEIYLEPFRIAIQKANPWSVMSSYNRVNGTYASESDPLLQDLLKDEWGYDGLVMSDWYGTYSDKVPGSGLDLEMPGPGRWMDPARIVARIESGELDEAHIDDKVRRLLRLIARVTTNMECPPADDQLPRQVASQAMVLLKNEDDLLPLDPDKPQRIAVIGENARWAQIMGGGSSQVNPRYAISPLEGIRSRVGNGVTVDYQVGALTHRLPPSIMREWLTSLDSRPGLTLEYYNNLDLSGEPAHSGILTGSEMSWYGAVNRFVDPRHFSMRLRGSLTAPESGDYQLHLWSVGRARLLVD
jgi:beta-glucosidase